MTTGDQLANIETLSKEQKRIIAVHLELLFLWNRKYSLTAIRDPAEAVRRHVLEALAARRLLSATGSDLLVDLGSGNGYPALPLLTAWTELRGILVEARESKAAFLRAVLRETGLASRVRVLDEHLPSPAALPAGATIVTLRGFPDPGRWIAGALALPNVRAVLAWLATDDALALAPTIAAPRTVTMHSLETGTLLFAR